MGYEVPGVPYVISIPDAISKKDLRLLGKRTSEDIVDWVMVTGAAVGYYAGDDEVTERETENPFVNAFISFLNELPPADREKPFERRKNIHKAIMHAHKNTPAPSRKSSGMNIRRIQIGKSE